MSYLKQVREEGRGRRKEKGERRKERGERRKEKGERRKEKGVLLERTSDNDRMSGRKEGRGV
jgi:hypothetical protein